ncbi:hypothetical protein A9Q84_08765 [Halobacteriovorax marinus]|uniref:Lipoprotein n=1 Tax=Halobacteriovorax marinus TaxID=97084 RepID=A0A1Y5F6L3_9BACT|nr:hypothetical protein A9Q84_08765 [Halobacteriovorax marinus]
MNRKKKILTLLVILSLTSCVQKTTNKKSSSTSTTQSSVVPPSTDPGTDDPAGDPYVDPSLPSYYSLPEVVVHGTASPNRNPPPNGIFWASNRNIGSNDQYIFQTDSKLNIRIKALSGPSIYSTDSNNVQCNYSPLPYTKLKLSVCVRSSQGSCVFQHTFDDIAVGSYSYVKEFSVPANTSDPLVIEVKDVQWDYTCNYYANNGFPNQPGYCPFSAVGYADCVKFQIEFSTDETQDLPGPRY